LIEPTITYPSCSTEIKLTESLAAPLIQATRQDYDAKIAQKEREFSTREAALRDQQKAVEQARNTIDEQVAEKLGSERSAIATEEARKAKLAAASDLQAKTREVIDLQEALAPRNAKLEEAQKAQADLLRKQRELDDARRVQPSAPAPLMLREQKTRTRLQRKRRLHIPPCYCSDPPHNHTLVVQAWYMLLPAPHN
jgi:hypothetical protein